MDDSDGQRIGRLFGVVLIFATLIMVIVMFVDQRIKKDILAEAARLREEMARVRRGETSPADQAGRGDGRPGPDPVVPVVDDPPAPPPAVADAGPADPGKVDGIGSPPHRGGIHAG